MMISLYNIVKNWVLIGDNLSSLLIGIANNTIHIPYCMAGWMQYEINSCQDVHFGLQLEIGQAWQLPEIFPETEHGHLAAFSHVINRLKRDKTIHDILVRHNLSVDDFPDKDPYGPSSECCQIIESRGTQAYRSVYGGWITRDTFEAIAFNVYGMAHRDFERWYEALAASELDAELTGELRKAYNRYRRDLERLVTP